MRAKFIKAMNREIAGQAQTLEAIFDAVFSSALRVGTRLSRTHKRLIEHAMMITLKRRGTLPAKALRIKTTEAANVMSELNSQPRGFLQECRRLADIAEAIINSASECRASYAATTHDGFADATYETPAHVASQHPDAPLHWQRNVRAEVMRYRAVFEYPNAHGGRIVLTSDTPARVFSLLERYGFPSRETMITAIGEKPEDEITRVSTLALFKVSALDADDDMQGTAFSFARSAGMDTYKITHGGVYVAITCEEADRLRATLLRRGHPVDNPGHPINNSLCPLLPDTCRVL